MICGHVVILVFFFFFKQKTAYEMRISDWSSDVCSSDLYDDIWVYGLPQVCDPLAGIDLTRSIRRKMTFTGYLRRNLPPAQAATTPLQKITEPFILVTTGGGGDGEAVIDWVLKAYEFDPDLPYPSLLVLGPFMQSEQIGSAHV